MSIRDTYNLNDDAARAKLHAAIDREKGVVSVEVKRYVRGRTTRQNAFYWPRFIAPFGEFLRDHGNTHFTDEMAHEVLKRMFLEVTEILPSGKRITYVRSTTSLTTVEFNEYLDKCAAFLVTECGFIPPEPLVYYESEYTSPTPKSQQQMQHAA